VDTSGSRDPSHGPARRARSVRRVGAVLGLAAVLLGGALATPAAAEAADALTPVTTTTPTMHPGQTAWVSVAWAAKSNVSNVAVTVTAPAGYTVSYPSDRAFTSLYGSASLAGGTQDFTAFRLSIPYTASGTASLTLHATWDMGLGKKDNDTTGRRTQDYTVAVPLVAYTGTPLTMTTTSLTVSKSTPSWVKVAFTGGAPSLRDVRVSATGPAGLVVTYPSDGTSSGLNDGSTLLGGASDYTSFRLDAQGLAPGTYPLDLVETYATAATGRSTGRVNLVVSP
jgi:hypothetical protein